MLLLRRSFFQTCMDMSSINEQVQGYYSKLLTDQENLGWEVNFFQFTLCSKGSSMVHNLAQKHCKEGMNLKATQLMIQQICKNYNSLPYLPQFYTRISSLLYACAIPKAKRNPHVDKLVLDLFRRHHCHDLQHNGTNLFEIKLKSNIAVTYAYTSVIEKFHASKSLELLGSLESSPFHGLSKPDTTRAKKIILYSMLATDMAKHYDYLKELTQQKISAQKQKDRQFVLEVMMHASDIMNPGMDYSQYIHWANLICMQFNDQTFHEQSNGMQSTEFMKFNSLSYFYMNQITFANNVVLPLWTQINGTMLDKRLATIKDNIHSNCKRVKEHLRIHSEPLAGLQKDFNMKLIQNENITN